MEDTTQTPASPEEAPNPTPEQTIPVAPPQTASASPIETSPQDLLQGDALTQEIANNKKLAQESAARVQAVLMTEFAAMEGVMPGLRGDYQYMRAFLTQALTKH